MSLLEQLTVRLARPTDLEVIVSFSAAMALETEGRHLDVARLRQGTIVLLEEPSHGFFMVTELVHGSHAQLVGQLMITYEWSDWRNGVFWWIQSVYVDPPWRRKGVFRRLHEELVQLAQSKTGVCGVRLYVEQSNAAAQTAYKRVGLLPSAYAVFEKDFVLARPTDTQQQIEEGD